MKDVTHINIILFDSKDVKYLFKAEYCFNIKSRKIEKDYMFCLLRHHQTLITPTISTQKYFVLFSLMRLLKLPLIAYLCGNRQHC